MNLWLGGILTPMGFVSSGGLVVSAWHCKGLVMISQSHSKGRVHWPTLRDTHIVWVKCTNSAES